MADKEKKEKKSNPLFDLINALFTSREYVYGITGAFIPINAPTIHPITIAITIIFISS